MVRLSTFFFLLLATALEVGGDATVRIAIYNRAGLARVAVFCAGAAMLSAYGFCLNLAPLDFGPLVGLYLAMFFVVWQAVNFLTFRTSPTVPILVGGALIIAGGMIVSFWKPG